LRGISVSAIRYGKRQAAVGLQVQPALDFKNGAFMTILNRGIGDNSGREIIEQRRAYLHQADAVARELCRLASVSDRTLGFLSDTDADAQLLDAVQQKSNDILALERQLRELWAPFLT
jgi:hypothetical protein